MKKVLFEAIPNISEGRSSSRIDRIVSAVETGHECAVIHRDTGFDTHRTVLTIVGTREGIFSGLCALYDCCASEIDMREHSGAHPRLGAVDVCPIVALHEEGKLAAITLAEELAAVVARKHAVPVYLYEKNARADYRRALPDVRRGEYEGLEGKLQEPSWAPDYGPQKVHPQLGATIIGARDFLVAVNLSLDTDLLHIAKEIAAEVRALREEGVFPGVRAIGWVMQTMGKSQVSLNITRTNEVPFLALYHRICALAAQRDCNVVGIELIGLMPQSFLLRMARDLGYNGVDLSEAISVVQSKLPFDAVLQERVLEKALVEHVRW